MIFVSSRDKNNQADFQSAIFQGLASDGGLFHPLTHPNLEAMYNQFNEKSSFNDIATEITWNLLKDEMTKEQAKIICNSAFDFEPTFHPLSENHSVLELFHGPSAAFKDYGASFLAASMECFLEGNDKEAIILTATSGDTGSAVAKAFFGKKNIKVVILYPSGRVSPLQEKQLTTLGGNIHALEVKGSFDDCQRIVKEAFTDRKLNDHYGLSSANSINLGRLIPQSFYYTWAWSRMKKDVALENITFCVPSGNFGNLTAGLYANRWGMKTGPYIAATNRNAVIPEYLKNGTYKPRPSVHTPSNAMDVGNPSNFERIQQLYSDHTSMNKDVKGYFYSDEETLNKIKSVKEQHNYFTCPHTAIGILAAEEYLDQTDNQSKVVTLSTAHPGKFLEVVEEATGEQPPLPLRLSALLSKEKHSMLIEATLPELKKALSNLFD